MPLTAEQHTARRSGIGGSDAAAAAGLSRWKSPLELYLEKRGETPPFEGNAATRWGTYLEPAVRQAYADETGRKVLMPEGTLRHATRDWMIFHPDGITEDGRVFEAKTARSADGWGEPGSAEIPVEYFAQVQHGLFVTGLEIADVAVLVGGSDFRVYNVPRDVDFQCLLVDAEANFWGRVEAGNPPPATTAADVRLLFGTWSKKASVEASPAVLEAVEKLAAVRDLAAELKEQEEALKVEIQLAMGPNEELRSGSRVLATWRLAKGAARLDGAALKVEFPFVHAQFLRTGEPSRRFLLK